MSRREPALTAPPFQQASPGWLITGRIRWSVGAKDALDTLKLEQEVCAIDDVRKTDWVVVPVVVRSEK